MESYSPGGRASLVLADSRTRGLVVIIGQRICVTKRAFMVSDVVSRDSLGKHTVGGRVFELTVLATSIGVDPLVAYRTPTTVEVLDLGGDHLVILIPRHLSRTRAGAVLPRFDSGFFIAALLNHDHSPQ